jgi:hypothetical protein
MTQKITQDLRAQLVDIEGRQAELIANTDAEAAAKNR